MYCLSYLLWDCCFLGSKGSSKQLETPVPSQCHLRSGANMTRRSNQLPSHLKVTGLMPARGLNFNPNRVAHRYRRKELVVFRCGPSHPKKWVQAELL